MNSKLFCPICTQELITDSLSEIFGYCCLNEQCKIGNTKPSIAWYLNDQLHYIEHSNGMKTWHANDGLCHREDGHAMEYPDGSRAWWINDKLHRVDGPAIEYVSGTKHWYINGERHREGGPAIENADGTKCWYINGKEQ